MTRTAKKVVLPIADLSEDPAFQSRTRTDKGTVDDYKEAMSSGAVMPPVLVALVEGRMYILDGWHRVTAARELMYDEIEAEVIEMSETEAIWRAAAANQSHGLRRSNADKIRAVEMVIALPASEALSDREIARRIGVSHEFVRQHRDRKEIEEEIEDADYGPSLDDGDDDGDDGENPAESPMEEAKRKYMEIVAMIDSIRASLTTLSQDPAGYSVNWNAIDADIRNAKRCLTDAMPHGICVYCTGDGCDACHHTGWLGKVAIEMAPKSMRKGSK